MKILIVDADKKAIPHLIEDLIMTYKYQVEWFPKADNVIRYLANSDVDAIILDIIMPIPSDWSAEDEFKADKGWATGIVLFEKIRQKHPLIPIVVCASYDHPINSGKFTSCLRKPELISTIVQEIQKLLANKK